MKTQTNDQKSAVAELKRASDHRSAAIAASAIERTFLQGKPDAAGWPRKF